MVAIGFTGPGPVLWALDMQVFVPGMLLALALLVGAAVLALMKRWRQRVSNPTVPDASEQLARFRALYEQGAMSEEEFNQVRAVLGGQLRDSLSLPHPASNPVPPGAVTPGSAAEPTPGAVMPPAPPAQQAPPPDEGIRPA
jgi:hypothetical protein